MRDGALPSRVNQQRFMSEVLAAAKTEGFRVTLFEAYDEQWKRQWEGTAGGSWGMIRREDRDASYPPATAVSDHPFWKLQLGCGLLVSLSVFGAALWAPWRRPPLRPASWFATALSATAGGVLFGVAAEKMLHESYFLGDWLVQGLLLGAATAAAPLAAYALMSGHRLPTFVELIGPREGRSSNPVTIALGLTLIVTTLIAAQSVLGLVFDPRSRDFPFAVLTMAAAPFFTLTFFNRPKVGAQRLAETVFAGLFALAALYILFNEGLNNWQSAWTSAAYLLFAGALGRTRPLAVSMMVSTASLVRSLAAAVGKQSANVAAGRRNWDPGAGVELIE